MFKLGIVTREGLMKPKTLFGQQRLVSFLLLRDLAADPEAGSAQYDLLVECARMPNGVWKRTRSGRMSVLDAVAMDIIRQRFTGDESLFVFDLAASTGTTSIEFYRSLIQHSHVHFVATDLYRDLIAVRNRRWPVAVIFDTYGREVQYICGPFVLPQGVKESSAYPVNLIIKVWIKRLFVPIARQAFHSVQLDALSPFEPVSNGSCEIVKLPILTKEVLRTIKSDGAFRFETWDILHPLPKRAHIIRAMNILTREHFTRAERVTALNNCVRAIYPGGLFIVGWSPTPDAAEVKASIYLVQNDILARCATLNGGSEIDDLIAEVFQVTEVSPASRPAVAFRTS